MTQQSSASALQARRDLRGSLGHRRVGLRLVALGAYVGSVVMANWATTHWPPLFVGALIVPAGTVWAGLTLILRDLLYETCGGRGVLVAIVVGAALSWWLATPQSAVVSVVAFIASELVDSLIYTRLRVRSRLGAVLGSNMVGLLTDRPGVRAAGVQIFHRCARPDPRQTIATVLIVAAVLIARSVRLRGVWR